MLGKLLFGQNVQMLLAVNIGQLKPPHHALRHNKQPPVYGGLLQKFYDGGVRAEP